MDARRWERKGDWLARAPLREGDPSRIGRYRLTARLGAGGKGVVYLGEAPHDGQNGRCGLVAVKVLRPELADDPELRERFGREVTSLVRVRGVCTVRVIEADTDGPRPFLVTEYADGPSLAEYVAARGPLDADMLFGLATGLAEALTAIHGTGVAHRDLKPSNVLLSSSGPKVIDFGIAQVLDATSVTQTGITVGSPGYMAPEQILGRAGTPADVFAWAVIIGYAARGQSPFGTGTSDGILYRILHAEPDLGAVPARLRPLTAAALAKEPGQRPTAHELLAELTSTCVWPGRGDDSPTQTVLLRTWRPPAARRRRALRTVALSLAAVAVAAGAVLGFTLTGPASTPRAAGKPTPAPTRDHATSPAPRRPAASTNSPAAAIAPARPGPDPGTPDPRTPDPRTPGPRRTVRPAITTAPALPVVTIGSYTGRRPEQIGFGAVSGNVVTGIAWSAWTGAGATGYGRSGLGICLPACIAAPVGQLPTTIVLSDPVHGRFTRLTETRAGSSTTYTYSASWPVSASPA